MNPALELTEKLLIETGGWPVFKQARALHERGAVLDAAWKPPLLQGSVREGERVFRAGLKLAGRLRIDNLCTCRPSREWGSVCAHSLAVGLAVLKGNRAAAQPSPAAPGASSLRVPAAAAELPFRSDPAASSRLCIVLPPNLRSAWAKDEIVLGLELTGKAKEHRKLINTDFCPENYTVILPDDHRVVLALAGIAAAHGSMLQGITRLGQTAFADALEVLRGHPRVTLGRETPLKVTAEPFRPVLEATEAGAGGVTVEVKWPPGSQPLLSAALNAPLWLHQSTSGADAITQITPGLPNGYQALYRKPTLLSGAEAAAFMSVEWPRLAQFFELRDLRSPGSRTVTPRLAPDSSQPAELRPFTFQLNLEGSLNELTAELHAVYQLPNREGSQRPTSSREETGREILLPLGSSDHSGTALPSGFSRGAVAEQTAVERLRAGGFSAPDASGRFVLRGSESILRFFAGSLPSLRRDWRVRIGARFEHVTKDISTVSPRVVVRDSGQDWFELDLTLVSTARGGGEIQTFSAAEIQRLLQMGRSSLKTKDGRLAVLPTEEWEDFSAVLRDIESDQRRPGLYRIKKVHAGYLDTALGRFDPQAGLNGWQEWKQGERTLARPVAIPLSPSLQETLRGYQKEGVYWLNFLAGNNLGGILADEMGLGKTLQTLAFLSVAHLGEAAHSSSSARLPSLVVCPSSLLENWRREAARFTPQLRTLVLHGEERAAQFEQIASADLVITSYALLRRDVERHRARDFLAVILDEGHHIKNPDSLSARAACALRARHRFVLTGTPVENSVLDLWSIMRFVLPGYLGSHQDFRERYEKPIAQGRTLSGGKDGPGRAARQAQERLTRRLHPFLLRRRKREVAAELPDKIEQVAYCELTSSQAQVYRELLEQSRRRFDEASRQKNSARRRMLALTALLRLRQVCCDLRLLGLRSEAPSAARELGVTKSSAANQEAQKRQSPTASENSLRVPDLGELSEAAPSETSGKLTLLDELLEQVREGEHRVLIFSQFVSMLKLLSAHFHETKLPFAYLDGATKDRAAVVDGFQNNPQITAFLISIKAGGTGLNLTAADTVIHFDPWWNPAVEAQATDRAHRIGQSRVVTAYKLITRGTVEEKILHLQRQKRELNTALVEPEGDEPLMTGLNLAEIETLLG